MGWFNSWGVGITIFLIVSIIILVILSIEQSNSNAMNAQLRNWEAANPKLVQFATGNPSAMEADQKAAQDSASSN